MLQFSIFLCCALIRDALTMAVTPRDKGAQKRFTEQLVAIRESLTEWEEEKTKIMAQMKSVMNLQQQLQTIHRWIHVVFNNY